MAFEVPIGDDFNPDAFDKVPNGRYHTALDEVEEDGGRKGEMVCYFEVLMGDDTNQVGHKIRVQFSKDVKMLWKIHRLALALGMITADEVKRLKAEGRNPTYDFPAAVGKQCHIELTPQKNEPKYSDQQFYRVDDAFCAAWPKNAGWIARAGIKVPAAPAGSGATNGNGTKAANGAPAAIPDVNFAGMV